MGRIRVLALALALGAAGWPASDAAARVVTVRFLHGDPTGVTAYRIYLREAGQAYGATPAWQGFPEPASDGTYSAQLTVPDGVTAYAAGTAVNASGESALSNEITLAPPTPACGNGALEAGEQCDDGNPASGDGCSAACTIERVPACGDGIRDAGEQCDDGNATAGDGCRADCTVEACGDARLDPAEQCDDGNTANGDGCSAVCTIERVPACGDGIRDAGEQCDDGNATAGDGCRADCTVEACGDARRDPGEQCDDGNDDAGDGCRSDCTIELCGDARLDPGEQCDDGNTAGGDGCSAACTREPTAACGNGVPEAGEQCDDGNATAGDGCDAQCRVEASPSPVPLHVNVGGPDYTDPALQTWRADGPYYLGGGTAGSFGTVDFSGTDADPLYRSRRYGDAAGPPMRFALPVGAPDLYFVRLHFGEANNEVNKAGQRVFDVLLEGAIRIEDVDVMREAGKRRAFTREATVYVGDGVLAVDLLPQVGRPMLSGIEVHRASEAPAAVPAPASPKIVGCGKSCR